jgi:hypothetical protein
MPRERIPQLYGVIAEFATPDELRAAAERAYSEGYREMDAYSPMPVHGLAEAIGFRRTRVPLLVLIGAILGGTSGYGLMYFMASRPWVQNVGGRPVHSWPAFIPVTFETTVLIASLFAVIGMLALNGLPQPYHPVFNVARFERASVDRFFLCIEADDPRFDLDGTAEFLRRLDAYEVTAVED